MIQIITANKEVALLQRQFEEKIKLFCDESFSNLRIGYPGGSFYNSIFYCSVNEVWFSSHKEHNRYWNGFGVGRPIDSNSNSITIEINFSTKGLNRNIAAVFGRDDNGDLLILHRGRLGGNSNAGKTMKFFLDHYSGDIVTATEGDRLTQFCVVAQLDSPNIMLQIKAFVAEVKYIKSLNVSEMNDLANLTAFKFTAESFGKTEKKLLGKGFINRTHGIVVGALRDSLTALGFRVANDRNRDLYTFERNKITKLFEIKTESTSDCIHTALGQLLVYSIPIDNKVALIAVFPNKLNLKLEKRFNEYGVKILYYEWCGQVPVFTNIENCLG